jgi:hypothetical protein
MRNTLKKLIQKLITESDETFDFSDDPKEKSNNSDNTFNFGDDPNRIKKRLGPSDDPSKSRGKAALSDKSSPAAATGDFITPNKKPPAPPKPPAPRPGAPNTKTPPMVRRFVSREEQLLKAANEVAEKYDLHHVEFLSKSSRPEGASAFSVYSDEFGGIILKLQPVEETDIYNELKNKSFNFPDEVMKHFPKIYEVSTLEKLGIDAPHIGGIKTNMGVILMEPLEHLPGNIWDLLSMSHEDSAVDKRALFLVANKDVYSQFINQFLNDPEVLKEFDKIEEHPLTKQRKSKTGPSHYKMSREEKIDLLKRMLLSLSVSKSFRDSVDERHKTGKSITMIIRNEIRRIFDNWVKSTGLISMLTSSLKMHFEHHMNLTLSSLSHRAIPRDPKNKKSEGPLGKLKGFESFNRAIDYLLDQGISPGDLHANNLMIRHSTGDIVFSDLGHFKLR